ncbi:Pathogenesis-related thaumatin superfamily protein [Euphorbia peplus]|nr:Pathogenesis-related thaumatin superfamily protein [Euphorbia peplus]
MAAISLLFNLILHFIIITGGYANPDLTFNFENNCLQTLWLSASPSDGDLDPEVGPDTLEIFSMSDPWTGSIWLRTKCVTNLTGYVSCETGDCGSGETECQGPLPTYPVTLLNFDIQNNVVQYEVSLIHGHNIGVRIQPNGGSLVAGGSGACPVVDCIADISNVCPASLVATNPNGNYVGCYNPCDTIKDPKYCGFNEYSQRFKDLCGLAHIYPGDNSPPLYKCSGAKSYNITFCPR